MGVAEKYISKLPDSTGHIAYTEQEDAMWQELINCQLEQLPGRACDEYLIGLETLNIPHDRIPQLAAISTVLQQQTGWRVEPVDAVIGFTEFFAMLADKAFPAATFIRDHDEVEYLQEPDIFHELFGHTPLLTDPDFANFTHRYGLLASAAAPADHGMLARLYWFTVEFGLIQTGSGLRAFGAGVLSSPKELVYALESKLPIHKPFDPVEILRTRYRIDKLQPVYFCLDSFDQLFDLVNQDIKGYIEQARHLGMHQLISQE